MKRASVPFEKLLTIYGRKPVLEALHDPSLRFYALHLSQSNSPSDIIDQIKHTAKRRGVEIRHHDKRSLSFISKNSRQDQGVALDIEMPNFMSEEEFLRTNSHYKIIAIDGVTNEQNLGLIIRSAAAGEIDALLLPKRGTTKITPLVIKASAGTLFKLPIMQTKSLQESLKRFKEQGVKCYMLAADAPNSLFAHQSVSKSVYILGNESKGVSLEIARLCDESLSIPMRRGVESLNVAMAATLIAFCAEPKEK